MSQQELPKTEKISLIRELENVFSTGWKLILVFALIGFVWATHELRSSVYVYPVQMQVTSVQPNSSEGGGQGARFGQLSGLASLANLTLPNTQNAMQFQLYIDSLTSRDLADDIAKNDEMMHAMFPGSWDATTQSWRRPIETTRSRLTDFVRGLFGLAPSAPWHAPDGATVQSFLALQLSVIQDPRKTYLVEVILTHPDKEFAVKFLNFLNKTVDDRLRERALTRARNYITYLTNKLENVIVAEHRVAIAQALSEQERYAMVASSGSPFAAELFEKPWASNLAADPIPRLVFLRWVLIGVAAGMITIFVRNRWGTNIRSWLQSKPLLRNLLPGFLSKWLLPKQA